MSENIVIVIPCYNEAPRFVPERFTPLLQPGSVSLLLVNDGSTDGTLAILQAMAARFPGRCAVLNLAHNGGKAEAVRRGLLQAVEAGPDAVGYLDADGATPGQEMARLVEVFRHERKPVLLAARIAMAGHRIERHPLRHYLGRFFATCAALALGHPVYDTQCGAKLFMVRPSLLDALRRPFSGRWAFDVELLGRLRYPDDPGVPPCPPEEWLEVPLRQWRDEPGSKMKATAMLGMGWALFPIALAIRRRRKALAAAGKGGAHGVG